MDGAAHTPKVFALLLRVGDIHRPNRVCRGVDRHGRGDFFRVDALKQDLHVGQAAYGHAALAHLAPGEGMVRVVAHEGGEVKGGGETGLAGFQEGVETPVGLLGAAEASKHPHGPELAAVHTGLHAARVRKLAGVAQVTLGVPFAQIVRRVDRLGLHVRQVLEVVLALRECLGGRRVHALHPRVLGFHRGTSDGGGEAGNKRPLGCRQGSRMVLPFGPCRCFSVLLFWDELLLLPTVVDFAPGSLTPSRPHPHLGAWLRAAERTRLWSCNPSPSTPRTREPLKRPSLPEDTKSAAGPGCPQARDRDLHLTPAPAPSAKIPVWVSRPQPPASRAGCAAGFFMARRAES